MKTGSSIVLIALAVADSMVLVQGLSEHLFLEGFGIIIQTRHKFLCKSYRYLGAVAEYTAVYDLIIFTIFRVISVYLPHKNNIYCNRKRALMAVTVTFITMCLVNLHLVTLSYVSLYDESSIFIGNDCNFNEKLAHFYQYHIDYLSLCLKSIAPFSILIIGNSMIIYKIRKSYVQRHQMTQTANQSADDSQSSMTAMLISISVLFLVTQMPYIITTLIERRMGYDDLSLEYKHGYYLLETFTRLLKFVNNVANFFLLLYFW